MVLPLLMLVLLRQQGFVAQHKQQGPVMAMCT
jgi:hypothetical protein